MSVSAIIRFDGSESRPFGIRYRDPQQRQKTFTTKHAAEAFVAELTKDETATDPYETVESYGYRYIDQHHGTPNTKYGFRGLMNLHIVPAFGKYPVCEVTHEMVKRLLLETIDSVWAAEHCRSFLNGLFLEAMADGKATHNPVHRVKIPGAVRNQQAVFHDVTYQELLTIESVIVDEWKLALWLMRFAGLRISEALAVNANCLSKDGTVLTVHEQLSKPAAFKSTGKRTAPLKFKALGHGRDIPVRSILREKIEAHCKRFGIGPDDYLFPAFVIDGRDMGAFRGAFNAGKALAHIPDDFSPHDLRHCYATECLNRDIKIQDLARYLGHENINVTFQTYFHLTESMITEDRKRLDDGDKMMSHNAA
jgi:integrase